MGNLSGIWTNDIESFIQMDLLAIQYEGDRATGAEGVFGWGCGGGHIAVDFKAERGYIQVEYE
jgi:hypothetical protein